MQRLVLLLGLVRFAFAESAAPPNTLTQAERDAGWVLLFDGQSTRGWLEVTGRPFPKSSWTVEDGWLKAIPKSGGLQDIQTAETFRWFELEWEWRCAANGNSGVKYLLLVSAII